VCLSDCESERKREKSVCVCVVSTLVVVDTLPRRLINKTHLHTHFTVITEGVGVHDWM
jgi:hypothetical protein